MNKFHLIVLALVFILSGGSDSRADDLVFFRELDISALNFAPGFGSTGIALCPETQRLYISGQMFIQLPDDTFAQGQEPPEAFHGLGLSASPFCAVTLARIYINPTTISSGGYVIFNIADGIEVDGRGFFTNAVGSLLMGNEGLALGLAEDNITGHFFVAGKEHQGDASATIVEFAPELEFGVPGFARPINFMRMNDLGLRRPSGLDRDPVTGDFFVTDALTNKLYRVAYGEITEMSDQDPPAIYFAPRLIYELDLEPFGIISPHAVAYNPLDGHVFVSDGRQLRLIEFAPVNAAPNWELYD